MSFIKKHLFIFTSWFITFLLIAGILFVAYSNKDLVRKKAPPAQILEATATPPSTDNEISTEPMGDTSPISNAKSRLRLASPKTAPYMK